MYLVVEQAEFEQANQYCDLIVISGYPRIFLLTAKVRHDQDFSLSVEMTSLREDVTISV